MGDQSIVVMTDRCGDGREGTTFGWWFGTDIFGVFVKVYKIFGGLFDVWVVVYDGGMFGHILFISL